MLNQFGLILCIVDHAFGWISVGFDLKLQILPRSVLISEW